MFGILSWIGIKQLLFLCFIFIFNSKELSHRMRFTKISSSLNLFSHVIDIRLVLIWSRNISPCPSVLHLFLPWNWRICLFDGEKDIWLRLVLVVKVKFSLQTLFVCPNKFFKVLAWSSHHFNTQLIFPIEFCHCMRSVLCFSLQTFKFGRKGMIWSLHRCSCHCSRVNFKGRIVCFVIAWSWKSNSVRMLLWETFLSWKKREWTAFILAYPRPSSSWTFQELYSYDPGPT